MGFRFRKRVNFGRFIRLNVSKSGISLGMGPPGLNVNLSRHGVRKTVGIPGSGLSYQTFSSWRTKPTDDQVKEENAASAEGRPKSQIWPYVVLGCGAVWAVAHWVSQNPSSQAVPTPNVSAPSSKGSALPLEGPGDRAPSAQLPQAVAAAPASQVATPSLTVNLLTADEVREMQTSLKALGFDPGPLDGIVGPQTLGAAQRYANARGISYKNELTRELLVRLLAEKTGGR